jgi:hypothetical protein
MSATLALQTNEQNYLYWEIAFTGSRHLIQVWFGSSCPHFRFNQGCQMDWFQTKNPNWGKFWSALDWKLLIYFMANWNILLRFGKFYGRLVHFVSIWEHFPVFGIMWQEKSGNPGFNDRKHFSCCIDLLRTCNYSFQSFRKKQEKKNFWCVDFRPQPFPRAFLNANSWHIKNNLTWNFTFDVSFK